MTLLLLFTLYNIELHVDIFLTCEIQIEAEREFTCLYILYILYFGTMLFASYVVEIRGLGIFSSIYNSELL